MAEPPPTTPTTVDLDTLYPGKYGTDPNVFDLQHGKGVPSGRAGVDAFLETIICKGNINGAAPGSKIDVAGLKAGDPILFVFSGTADAGDDFGGEAWACVEDGKMIALRGSDSSGLKLNVVYMSRSGPSLNSARATSRFRPVEGAIDALFYSLRAAVGAGAGAGVAMPCAGIDATDIVLFTAVTDATVDTSAAQWTPGAGTVQEYGAPVLPDLTGKKLLTFYIKEPLLAAGETVYRQVPQPITSAKTWRELFYGLNFGTNLGPDGSNNLASTSGSFQYIKPTNQERTNIMSVFAFDGTDLTGGQWSTHADGGIYTAESVDYSGKVIGVLWFDAWQARYKSAQVVAIVGPAPPV